MTLLENMDIVCSQSTAHFCSWSISFLKAKIWNSKVTWAKWPSSKLIAHHIYVDCCWPWQWVQCTQMAPNSHQISIQQSTRTWLNRRFSLQMCNICSNYDAVMSIRIKVSEECFQYLVESIPWRTNEALKAREWLRRWTQVASMYISF